MNHNSNTNMYEGLASYFLPAGALEYFEVTDFAEIQTRWISRHATRKTVLHVRRRRWTMPDGTTKSVDLDSKTQLKHTGTRYSKDFALFLKKADGQ